MLSHWSILWCYQGCNQLHWGHTQTDSRELGTLRDTSIILQPTLTPVIHAPRRCPIALKDEIKRQLDRVEEMGVISRVSKPTDWVSSLVYSRKSSGRLRISLDPKYLNRAIKRPHYHTIVPWRRLPTSLREPQYYPSWMHATAIGLSRSTKSPVWSPPSTALSVSTDSLDYHSAWTWSRTCSRKGWISS